MMYYYDAYYGDEDFNTTPWIKKTINNVIPAYNLNKITLKDDHIIICTYCKGKGTTLHNSTVLQKKMFCL